MITINNIAELEQIQGGTNCHPVHQVGIVAGLLSGPAGIITSLAYAAIAGCI